MPTKVTVGGRLVWASGNGPLDPVEVIDNKTKQPRLKQDGSKMMERGFGLAVPKMINGAPNPEFAAWWAAATAEAAKVCNGAAPAWPNNRVFSYKLTDGDGKAAADIARNLPERDYPVHYKGCWVISIKSQLPQAPTVYDGSSGQWLQVDPTNIRGNPLKVGDYVKVGLSVDGHLGESPGLYMNPDGIMFIGFGEAISRGPDANAMFGAAGAVALPPGASATPVGPAGAPAMPGQPPAAPVAPGLPPSAPGLPGNPIAPVAVPPGLPPAAPVAPPIASPGNPPLAPALPGFAVGAPALPGMPATPPAAPPAAPPAPPAAPPAIAIAGYDKDTGKAWGVDPATGASVWLS